MQKRFDISLSMMILLATSGYGFSFGFQPSEEQLQMQQALMKKFLTAQQQMQGNTQNTSQNITPIASMSESEMDNKIKSLPSYTTFMPLTRVRTGFSLGGHQIIDSEGSIATYGYDAITGYATYTIKTSESSSTIKTMRASGNMEPITIATATYNGNMVTIHTATGKTISGNTLIMGSKGFVVARKDSAFVYIPGEGMHSIALPENLEVADFQNGDPISTGYLLLERPQENDNSGGGLLSSVKALSSSLGIGQKNDYALLETKTGKMFSLNVPNNSKDLVVCNKSQGNGLIKKCLDSSTFESLYDPSTGLPNYGHYFWRIAWFNTKNLGPIALSTESGLRDLIGTQLSTGKRVLVKERLMGINKFDLQTLSDGKISVKVQLGFSTETVDDLESFISSASDMNETK